MFKIYLSPSDQVENRYAYGGTNENDQCERIADATEKALERCGFAVKNNKKSSMKDRVSESNKWGADLHVAIHTNAFNKKVTGTRLFCYSKTGPGYKACQSIFKFLAPLTPGTSENIKVDKTLYETRKTNMATVYLEIDFHDVKAIAQWIIEHVEEIGEAIAEGICDYFKVEYKEPEPIVEVKPVNESETLYLVQVGAFKSKEKAEAYANKVKAAGFSTYIKKEEKAK